MGKKTKIEKENIQLNLDIQMNLASDLAQRNPKLKILFKHCPLRFVDMIFNPSNNSKYKEFDKLFKKIYGDSFPVYPFPVERVDEYEKEPSELLLRINLNYTKDEIIHSVEGWLSEVQTKYQEKHFTKYKRKTPKKWQTYFEIWDLKNGDRPWFDAGGGLKGPRGRKGGKTRPWTYEEIAKHSYPEAQEPEELNKAIDKVKKQYRSAYKLICGKVYVGKKFKERLNLLDKDGSIEKGLCSECTERECEKNSGIPCARLENELSKGEVKQQELLVGTSGLLDLENFEEQDGHTMPKPTADNQF